MNYQLVISRALVQVDGTLYKKIEDSVTPMLTDVRHISDIHQAVKSNHPDFDETDMRILTVACIYDFYCPASFLPKAAMKLPIGIRNEAARVLGYSNPENVNSWHSISRSYMKGRAFKARVDVIKAMFKQYSVRSMDWELNLV